MIRDYLEDVLACLLAVSVVVGCVGWGIAIYNKPPTYAPLLSCALKDGSTVAADSFVISSNTVNLSVDGSLMLIPYSEVRYCYQALAK